MKQPLAMMSALVVGLAAVSVRLPSAAAEHGPTVAPTPCPPDLPSGWECQTIQARARYEK
jgi:hypothetical protein